MASDLALRNPNLTRTGLEVQKLSEAWKGRSEGDRFTKALLTFLGSKTNRGTQRVYGFAITEFFTWFKTTRGYYPLPNQVERADVARFVRYLLDRALGVDEQRLERDPERALDLEIYRYIAKNPESRITAVRQHLLRDARFATIVTFNVRGTPQTERVLQLEKDEPRGDAREEFVKLHNAEPVNELDLLLAELCQHNLLRRSPSVAEIRSGEVDLGLEDPSQAQIGYRVDPTVFRYWANEYTAQKGKDRASTVITKLSALSSYWNWLVQSTAENTNDQAALLRVNIWREAIASLRPAAINRAKATRELSVPDKDLFIRVLSATFRASHGSEAMRAASAALEGADVSGSATGEPTAYDLRDRAALLFCYWTGVRAEELGSIRREDLDPRTGLVTVTGKGDLQRSFRVPDPALRAIFDFQRVIDFEAGKATGLRSLLDAASAPLFPPLKLWGRAAKEIDSPEVLEGLTPSALARMLHERAEQAGVEKGSDDYYRAHPHGLRHLAALEANRRGVDVATIQATLGHGSLATTGIYLEVRDPLQRSLQPTAEAPRVAPPVTIEAEPTRKARERVEAAPKSVASTQAVEREEKPIVEPTIEIEPVEHEELEAVSFAPPEELMEFPVEEEISEDDALVVLYDVYANNWGEEGTNQRSPIRAVGKAESVGLLAHAYAGVLSSLPWWSGPRGLMKGKFSYTPNEGIAFSAMPIMSPYQFAAGPDGRNAIADGLADLYRRWTTPADNGGLGVFPSAASALIRWISLAGDLSNVVNTAIESLEDGEWVSFDSPLIEPTKPPTVIREHDPGAVVAWFEATAWQWRPSASGLPSEAGWPPPAWYVEPDPLASIPAEDRAVLLDALRVLVGESPEDRTPRFGPFSRYQVGQFLKAICAYESFLSAELEGGRKKITKSDAAQIDLLNKNITTVLQRVLKGADSETQARAEAFSYADVKAE